MDSTIQILDAIVHHIPFTSATWFVIAILGFFVWLFAKADKDPTTPVYWEHLIIDSNNDRASPYKVGYLVGIIVSTWVIIRMADAGNVSLDIFGVYLTFLLGGAGINTFVKASRYRPMYPQQDLGAPEGDAQDDPNDADAPDASTERDAPDGGSQQDQPLPPRRSTK